MSVLRWHNMYIQAPIIPRFRSKFLFGSPGGCLEKSSRGPPGCAIFSGGILAVAAFFLVVVRSLNITVAGVEPEALVLTAMMTAPFTLGFLLLLVLGAAAAERVVRRGRA